MWTLQVLLSEIYLILLNKKIFDSELFYCNIIEYWDINLFKEIEKIKYPKGIICFCYILKQNLLKR